MYIIYVDERNLIGIRVLNMCKKIARQRVRDAQESHKIQCMVLSLYV